MTCTRPSQLAYIKRAETGERGQGASHLRKKREKERRREISGERESKGEGGG